METAQVFLMEPQLYGGKVLPFAIIAGTVSDFKLACGLLDIEKNDFKYNVAQYRYNNKTLLEGEAFNGEIIPFFAKLRLYNLIMQHHPDILTPLDKIDLRPTSIYKILVFMSHPDSLPLLHDFNIMVSKIDSVLSHQIKCYAGSRPNLQPEFYWNVSEV